MECCTKTNFQVMARATFVVKTYMKYKKMVPSADPSDPSDPGEMVHGLLLGTSPTRAGGQDDVSLEKLPQTNLVVTNDYLVGTIDYLVLTNDYLEGTIDSLIVVHDCALLCPFLFVSALLW